jgi:hypothetical protein
MRKITRDAAFGNNRFVVGGSRGFITCAPEDSLWTLRYPGLNASIQSIAYGNRRFVAVGWNGAILSCDEDKLGARMKMPPVNYESLANAAIFSCACPKSAIRGGFLSKLFPYPEKHCISLRHNTTTGSPLFQRKPLQKERIL